MQAKVYGVKTYSQLTILEKEFILDKVGSVPLVMKPKK